MITRRRYDLVLAIYPQSRGFAFALFESWLSPVDWGIHEARGPRKNAQILARINSLLELHMPDVIVLQDMSNPATRRVPRIQDLNRRIAELAHLRGIVIHKYSRALVLDHFMERDGARRRDEAEGRGNDRQASSGLQPLRPAGAQALDERGSTDGHFRRCCIGMDVFSRS
jgi:hypothetical protein